ncbi:bifunctional metallophosphatase/5'-nucleotidase [Actinocatenispora rupis]|uniref:5'-nucleotidase n=1 Tax=Actinocatenispora rupis TaxID=519421 RepID=A0A8J3N7X1_9ACTN|nr:bifunctional metallophosphatase/5'-nucleotidase [Actinocatenispora rupis]GID09516.1 5'-nucleotidase [Actinocatenispora rupis]
MDRRIRRRTFLTATGALATAAAVGDLAYATPAAADPASTDGYVDVQLLNITDLHGYLQPTTPSQGSVITGAGGVQVTVGGVGYMATHLKRLREGRRNSIFFSSGDNFSGWPFEVDAHANEPTVEALNAMGLQFSTVGNHELDQSVSFLIDHMEKGAPYPVNGRDDNFVDSTGHRFRGADFRFYTANIVDAKSGRTILPPYNIEYVDAGNGKQLPIAFIHLTLVGTEVGSTSYQPGLRSLSDLEQANTLAAQLKKQGVHAIVINIHDGGVAGNDYNAGTNPSGPVFQLAAKASPDIAAIVTGHWHCRFNMMVPDPNGVPRPVVEAGNHGSLINEITLKLDPRTGEVVRELTTSTNHANTRDVPVDPEVQGIADYWTAQGRTRYATKLTTITGDFTRTPNASGESTMGNLAADFAYWDANQNRDGRADLALIAVKPVSGSVALTGDLKYAKGTGANDADGTVLFGEAWNAFGYGNPVLTVTLPGTQLHAAFEAQWVAQADGSEKFAPFAVSGNVTYTYDTSRPIGQRVDPAGILIDGTPLDTGRNYRVAALAYTLIGGDGNTVFAGFTDPVRNDRDHEGFIKYLRAHPVLSPSKLGRATPAT